MNNMIIQFALIFLKIFDKMCDLFERLKTGILRIEIPQLDITNKSVYSEK